MERERIQKQPDDSLAGDKLRGAKAIAEFIDEDIDTTFYWIRRGYIPVRKIGNSLIASKAELRRVVLGEGERD